MKRVAVLAGLLVLAAGAQAGDIYKCKGPNGPVFQGRPCAAGATQAHQHYHDEPSNRPVVHRPSYRYHSSRPAVVVQRSAPVVRSAPRRAASTAAHRCTAGNKTWVQTGPCPTDYSVKVHSHLDGWAHTAYGDLPVSGESYRKEARPVRDNAMSKQALCTALSNHAAMGQDSDNGPDDAYERNKLRDQMNCGY
ncbi:MAG TPA: hypothetical protein VFG73_02445 [Rhodanobacteraceae bacterium]|nr:hypothetical protein [Rhodanobacteraceae bacterium]